ncbi:hypothetical protein JCM10212_001087 [Sporobolomyces blumeae]
MSTSPLANVELLLFDTFGTLTDYETSISTALAAKAKQNAKTRAVTHEGQEREKEIAGINWLEFERRWRSGYMTRTREIAQGGEGPSNVDELHLEILNEMVDAAPYDVVGQLWDTQAERKKVCQLWHRIKAWPDVKPGMGMLKKLDPPVLLATLSNGSLRLLVDIARTNSLPFDTHFSGDLLGAYKPNPKMYLGAPKLLGYEDDAIKDGKVAMVASHIYDLRAAAQHGLKTIYIPRSTEDVGVEGGGSEVRPKHEGGEVDVVLKHGLEALAGYLRP